MAASAACEVGAVLSLCMLLTSLSAHAFFSGGNRLSGTSAPCACSHHPRHRCQTFPFKCPFLSGSKVRSPSWDAVTHVDHMTQGGGAFLPEPQAHDATPLQLRFCQTQTSFASLLHSRFTRAAPGERGLHLEPRREGARGPLNPALSHLHAPRQPRWAALVAWMCPGLPPGPQAGHSLCQHLPPTAGDAPAGTPAALAATSRQGILLLLTLLHPKVCGLSMHAPQGGPRLSQESGQHPSSRGPGTGQHFPQLHLL